MRVLTVNAGSSSLKLRLLGPDDELLAAPEVPTERGDPDPDRLADALSEMPEADVVGHRIVHGGQRFRKPVRIDSEVQRALRALADLAPLHQPKSLAALDAVGRTLPDVPAVACFDTAFHTTIPPAAATYALPQRWRETFGLRRYGFHGLSHAYATRRSEQMLGERPRRLVVCHLGAGASVTAVSNGRSIDTTMGFTPLEGLVMATRSGSVDPGMLLWLLERQVLSDHEMSGALEHGSGLLGLAGTADMARVLDRASAGERDAVLARDVYIHRLRGHIAMMIASLGGIDALVFTGGVGENSAEVRSLAAAGLSFVSVAVDEQENTGEGDRAISVENSEVSVLVIESREDLEIAAQVRSLLANSAS